MPISSNNAITHSKEGGNFSLSKKWSGTHKERADPYFQNLSINNYISIR